MKAGGWLLSILGMAGLYVLFAGSATVSEAVAGAICLTAGGVFVLAANQAVKRRFDFNAEWRKVLPGLLRSLVLDTWLVARALLRSVWRPVKGQVTRQPFVHGGDSGAAGARRALVVIAASAAPNGFVVHVSDDSDFLLMHRLVAVAGPDNSVWPV